MLDPGLTRPIENSPTSLEQLRHSATVKFQPPRLPRRWWLSALLFAVTLVSTTVFGCALVSSFAAGRPLDLNGVWETYVRLGHGDLHIWSGLRFSGPLLLILLTHEFGHYVECRLWRVDASLPYFLPSPTLFGTLGAFIRIRSPIYSRRGLFDIGVSGPVLGFIMLLPFLIVGVALSHPLPDSFAEGPFVFGTPLALRLVEWLKFGGLAPSRILLHPMAMAAWAGLLATAINLLPMGQLDGGHILYAVFGERQHRVISTVIIAALVALGFFYWTWWVWAVVMFFWGRRHPLVYDQHPLTRSRLLFCGAALAIFVLSVCLVPVRAS